MTKTTDTPKTPAKTEQMPPAGPHAKPEETDKSKTPGSGMFPESEQKKSDAPSG